jgi:hypothetical protein
MAERYAVQNGTKDRDGDELNVATRVAKLYQAGKIGEAKDLYRTAGMDSYITEDMQETAQATQKTKSGLVKSTGTRLWNDRGELNASDTKDAIGLLERHAAQTIWNPSNSFVNISMSDKEKEDVMTQIQDEHRRGSHQTLGRLTAQLQRPVRRALDYIGFARKAAIVHDVGQGEIPYYDLDPEVTAYVVAGDAAVPATRVESGRIFPKDERIMANVQISIEEAAKRSFNSMERSKDLAIQDIQRREDEKLLNAWWTAGHGTNTPVNLPATLTLGAFESVAYSVDRNDLHTTRIYMNRAELRDIRTGMISQFDPVTQREVFNTGMLGTLFDYAIYVSPTIVPAGIIFATTEPDYLSYISIWFNTTAEIANRFPMGEPVYGFTFFEVLGFTVVNDAAVAVGIKPGTTIPSYFNPLV